MKKIKILIILAVSINTILCGQSKSLQIEAEDENLIAWKSIDDEQFEIKYPNDWELDQSGQMGSSFFLFSPLSDSTDNFRENVNLMIQDLAGLNLDLEAYSKISEEQIKTLATDGKIFLNDRIKDGEAEYQKVIYSATQGIYDLKFEQCYRVLNDKAYILTLTCENSAFDDYQKTGEAILNSFKIKKSKVK